VFSQVGIGTTSPHPSSSLEISSSNSGVLIPRLTKTQKNNILNPAEGLLVYQKDGVKGFWYFNGTVWKTFEGDDNDWVFNGNDIYNGNSGNIGIGVENPTVKLHLEGKTVSSNAFYFEDFSSSTISSSVSNTMYAVNSNTLDPWLSGTNCSADNNWNIIGQQGYVQSTGGRGCFVDNTLVSAQFTPSVANLSVSFNYNFVADNSTTQNLFKVALFNQTTNNEEIVLLNINDDATGFFENNYSVISGNMYTIRFQFKGRYDGEKVNIDNILVKESPIINPIFRLVDGSEGVNKILTSDANGNATWMRLGNLPSSKTFSKEINTSGKNIIKGQIITNNIGIADIIVPNQDLSLFMTQLTCIDNFSRVKIISKNSNRIVIQTVIPKTVVNWLLIR